MLSPSSALSRLPVAMASLPRSEERRDAFRELDRLFHAQIASFTGGLAPSALVGALADWAVHLASSPGKQLELVAALAQAVRDNVTFAIECAGGADSDPCEHALPQDRRFRAPEWRQYPFNLLAHGFLSVERWWEAATTGVAGVSRRHQDMTTFLLRQYLDTLAPSNFAATNPQVLAQARAQHGMNFVRGGLNFIDDVARRLSGRPPAGLDTFKVGETVAVTPGKVVRRTALAEIIQYAPATREVRPEPVVIIPAWIMKYYILDLSPNNSLVRYLTEQGFTVFMVSWKNPGSEDSNTSFDDYRTEGLLPALQAALSISGAARAHMVGYCLGGTLLTAAAAAMARDHDDRVASLTLLAAQADFTEAGELMLFVDEAQISLLEDMMAEHGYLEAGQMAGAFQMLRSNDLIWSKLVHDYLMGQRDAPIDIMAWNADATRMPYRMHSEYLRSLFLNNDLAEGRIKIGGDAIAIEDIRAPLFVVGTEQDHVAPWRSVYKFNLMAANCEVTFVLTNGGHNAGVLSQPGHAGRHYRTATRKRDEPYIDPDRWFAMQEPAAGSWWPAWVAWLSARSGAVAAPPPLGDADFPATDDAPGRYVLMR